MKVSRVVVGGASKASQTFACDPSLVVISTSTVNAERLLAAFRNLYRGIDHDCQIYVSIDGVEFPVTKAMTPLIGERLDGRFDVLDLTHPTPISPGATDIRDVQALVARAALEITGRVSHILDLERIDQTVLAIDRYRNPLSADSPMPHSSNTGLLQLFSRRTGQEFLDADDPAVKQLARFDAVLAARRRQIASSDGPRPDEFAMAVDMLRELVSARPGGVPRDSAATMSTDAVQRDIVQWTAQQHDRQMTPMIAETCARHAEGVSVLGPIPIVLDMRRIEGLPPGGDAIRWASRQHGEALQFIVLVDDDDARRWIERTFDPSAIG